MFHFFPVTFTLPACLGLTMHPRVSAHGAAWRICSIINIKTRGSLEWGMGLSLHWGILLLSLHYPTWKLCILGGLVQGVGMGYLRCKHVRTCTPLSIFHTGTHPLVFKSQRHDFLHWSISILSPCLYLCPVFKRLMFNILVNLCLAHLNRPNW